jgi:hypothetical protein
MNECTICFDTMQFQTDKLTMCHLCGRCVHTKCFTAWKKKSGTNKCLYCQVEDNLYKINRSWLERYCCCYTQSSK